MIGFKAYRSTPTTLDLNGPFLSYTTQPVGLTTESSTINLVGIVTALPEGGTGEIAYQWYEVGYGPIASGSTITGTATTTLTLNELNSFIRPTKGSYLSYDNIFSPSTNSDNGFIQNILTYKKYYKFQKLFYYS